MLLGYAGFLRYNELAHIKRNNLQLFSSYVEVVIESSKTDIYRQGNTSVIARTNSEFYPVGFFRKISETSKHFSFVRRIHI